MKIKRVAHIAIAAERMESVKSVLGDLLNLPLVQTTRFESGTEMAMYTAGNLHLEVLHNTAPESIPGCFVKKNGTGFFHICLEVEDLQAAIAELTAKGVRLRSDSPKNGASGSPVVFLEPATTGGLLIELVQEEGSHNTEAHLGQ